MKRLLIIILGMTMLVGGMKAADDSIVIDEQKRDSLWQEDDFVRAYLVVAEPGGALYSIFGHACLHLVCPAYDLDYMFTYESEDASKKVLKFLSGNLKMGMTYLSPEEYLESYATEGRGVVEYELNLSIGIKRELWRVLDEHVMEGVYLPYDFEARGCAYACTQMLKEAMGETKIEYGEWPKKYYRTRREMCNDCAKNTYPWNMMLIMAIVGSEVDKEICPQNKLIIPTELAEAWQMAKVDGVPLLSSEPRMLLPSENRHQAPWCRPWMVAVLLLVLAVANLWGKCKYMDWLMLGVVTLIGAVITYLVVFSSLPCTEWNWLIIPFNILPAIAWHWRKYWSLPMAGILVVWLIAMVVPAHQWVDTALWILTAAWVVTLIGQRKVKP